MSARPDAGSATRSAPRKRPAALAAGLAMIVIAMVLEKTLERALLLAHDRRSLARGDRLAGRGIFLQALLLEGRIDHGAVGLRLAPEHQGIGERPRIGFVLGGLGIDQLADVGIDAGGAGALQERRLA